LIHFFIDSLIHRFIDSMKKWINESIFLPFIVPRSSFIV